VTIRKSSDTDLRPAQDRHVALDWGKDRQLGATWLRHVEALRQERLAAEDPEAARVRGIVLANERLICGDGRSPIG
jgi:hypothetical protein